MAEEACKFLREVDAYFNNEIVDENKFNQSNSYKCPFDNENKENHGCKNNNARISALGEGLYQKLASIASDLKGEGDNGNRHIEIFTMWLCDKLYMLEKNNDATLKESYEKYLKDYIGNFEYWGIIGSEKVYNGANVWYMSELYSLLKDICDLDNEYNKNINNVNKEKIGEMSNKFSEKFISIYNNAKDCYSYLHLLKPLKNIYDDIRNNAIKNTAIRNAVIKSPAIGYASVGRDYIKQSTSIVTKINLNQILKNVGDISKFPIRDLIISDWNQGLSDKSDQKIDFHTQTCVNSHSKLVEQVKKDASKDISETQPHPGSDQSGKGGDKKPSDLSQNSLSLQNPPAQSTDNQQKASPNEQADLENAKKLLKFLSDAQNTFEKYRSPFYNAYTKIKKRVNESIKSALENAHTNSIYIADKVSNAIKQVSDQLQKNSTPTKEKDSPPDHKKSEPKPPSSSSTEPQTSNLQPTNISLNGQKNAPPYSNNLMSNSVTDTRANEKIQKAIFIGNIFKGSIPPYVKVIVILIPITLAIMYKCLPFEWRKELKRKKNVKKVINLIDVNKTVKTVINPTDGKKHMQIIIKSVDMKKMEPPVINPICGEKRSLLNIYKLTQANPVPFINLFFLLIFFVYKRKDNFLEL
ncbi:PIR protein CIR protein [Plasmodium vinckei brucechwatti]|uniref:PIR protein CIR protein n=1 Tax=Plasmodium vinckei brucechwatti TaxID=119398 RepID=A0A6V7RUZ8_PLAVN|nr:PIR protein CIR protein [Plasmodium vinckei brucechwatti]